MSEKQKPDDSGEQAVNRELEDDLRNYAGIGSGEDGRDINIAASSTEMPIHSYDSEERSLTVESQVAKTVDHLAGEHSTATISRDTTVRHRKGSVIPPRLPKKEIQHTYTAGSTFEAHQGKPEARSTYVSRRASIDQTTGEGGEVTRRDASVKVVKTTTHAPRGMEEQEYHHRGFKDSLGETAKEKEERYAQLLMKQAAKQVRKAKDAEVWGSEIEDNPEGSLI